MRDGTNIPALWLRGISHTVSDILLMSLGTMVMHQCCCECLTVKIIKNGGGENSDIGIDAVGIAGLCRLQSFFMPQPFYWLIKYLIPDSDILGG